MQIAENYAGLGWCIVPVACRGKMPLLAKWPELATTDSETIAEWYERWPDMNVGVLLGPRSGIVDVEYDGDEGAATAAELFAGGCFTPTFRSARSVHRLFRWSEAMPDVPGKIEYRGLELRLGHRKRGIQSVFPPSVHESGVTYTWEPGLSPDDVDVQELPAVLWAAIQTQTEGISHERSKTLLESHKAESIGEGGRNEFIYRAACSLWRTELNAAGPRVFDSDDAQTKIYDYLQCMNQVKCSPPLGQIELLKTFSAAKQFISRQTDEDRPPSPRIEWGLARDGIQWLPGQWRLTIVLSDPIQILLHVPFTSDPIVFDYESFDDPQRVHRAVGTATGGAICLADRPRRWPAIWNGAVIKTNDGTITTIGLKAKLLSAADRVSPPDEIRRKAALAEAVVAILDKATVNDNPSSRSWLWRDNDGSVIFKFGRLLKQLEFERIDVSRNGLSKFLRDNCEAEQRAMRLADKRIKRMAISADGWQALEGMV